MAAFADQVTQWAIWIVSFVIVGGAGLLVLMLCSYLVQSNPDKACYLVAIGMFAAALFLDKSWPLWAAAASAVVGFVIRIRQTDRQIKEQREWEKSTRER